MLTSQLLTAKSYGTEKELVRLVEQYEHAIKLAAFHWKDNGPALYGGDIMWVMGWADWITEAEIIEEKITLYLRLLNV